MKIHTIQKYLALAAFSLLLIFSSCNEGAEEQVAYDVPDAYLFSRNDMSSVSTQGQKDRLNMLSEIKSYLQTGDAGEELDADLLLKMFANEDSPFESADLNASTKQIENKTATGDVAFYKELFEEAETVSREVKTNGTTAVKGTAGQIERKAKESNINVNAKGWEFTQMIEKGLMGALIYNQIYNSYLTVEKVGNDVENTLIEEGKNYTPMEHHWDEAFGYFGVPINFPNGEPALSGNNDRFWAEYTLGRDEDLNIAKPLMTAYITGRAAIVAKDYETKNAQIFKIRDFHEIVAAATAVHYINAAIKNIDSPDQGSLFHHMSEAYGFVNAIKYNPTKNLTSAEINTILNTHFGTNADFWTVTKQGLQAAKTLFASTYPELSSRIDTL